MGCTQAVDAVGAQQDFKYKANEKLGEGSSGTVFQGFAVKDKREVAIKVLPLTGREGFSSSTKFAQAKHEVNMWSLVGQHKHCIELMAHYREQGLKYCLVMERCHGSLTQLLRQHHIFSEKAAAYVCQGMLAAIEHLHQKRIMHRDIKPDNFLLGGGSGTTVLLADFGLAGIASRRGLVVGTFGTTPYMSPEMVGGQGHTLSTDVWSLGVTMYQMVYGRLPYMHPTRSSKSIRHAIFYDAPPPAYVCREAKEGEDTPPLPSALTERFVRDLMTRSHEQRPSIVEVVQQPYLSLGEAFASKREAVMDFFMLQPGLRREESKCKKTTDSAAEAGTQRLPQLLGRLNPSGAKIAASSFNSLSSGADRLSLGADVQRPIGPGKKFSSETATTATRTKVSL